MTLTQTTTEPCVNLRFFDLDVVIRSDSDRCIDLFTQMYRRFQIDTSLTAPQPASIEFIVRTTPDSVWGKPVLIMDNEVRPLHNPRLMEGYVYESILNSILSRVRSHFLIHAGVVARGNQGVMLVADSGHGKTTLVLELVRRGFAFLSDEIAALSRDDRKVYPFPRSLRIRPGTLELVGIQPVANSMQSWMGKLLVDMNEIWPASMGRAVPIRHIIVLHNPNRVEKSADCPYQKMGIRVDRIDRGLLAAIKRIEGVTDVRTAHDRGYPMVWLCARRRTQALSHIELLCLERQIALLGVVTPETERPDFQSAPYLEEIPPSQAVMELVQRFLGGHRSALLQADFGGSATRLFVELAACVNQAKCYRLHVGSLHKMANLVSGLVHAAQGGNPIGL